MVIHRLPVKTETGVSFRDFQAELTEVGRIRIGVFDPDKGGRGAPDKLEFFRFTSQQELLIRKVAKKYGGMAEEYQPQRSRRTEWQVITTSKMIPVYVEPQRIDPWLEAWGGSVGSSRCVRRCDGITETKQDVPCPCAAGQLEEKDMCKPVARVQLLLAEVPGIGLWRLESHGTKFVEEIAGLAPYVAMLPCRVPGLLYLEGRRAQPWVNGRQLTTTVYVPHLSISVATPEQFAIGGDVLTRALEAGTANANAIGAGEPVRALGAAPDASAEAATTWHSEILKAADMGRLEGIRAAIKTLHANGDLSDAQFNTLGAAWIEARDRFQTAAQATPASTTDGPQPDRAVDPGLAAIAERVARPIHEVRTGILADIERCDTTAALVELKERLKARGVADEQIKQAAQSRYAAIFAAAEVGGSAPGTTSVTAGNAAHQQALRNVQVAKAEAQQHLRQVLDGEPVEDAVLVDEPPPFDVTEYAVGDTVTVGGTEFTKIGEDPFGPGVSDVPDASDVPGGAAMTTYSLDAELNAVYTAAGGQGWTTTQTNAMIKQAAGVERMDQLDGSHAYRLHLLAADVTSGAVAP